MVFFVLEGVDKFMSCTFWNLRKRRAAELAKQAPIEAEQVPKEEAQKEKKSAKKGVKKNDK